MLVPFNFLIRLKMQSRCSILFAGVTATLFFEGQLKELLRSRICIFYDIILRSSKWWHNFVTSSISSSARPNTSTVPKHEIMTPISISKTHFTTFFFPSHFLMNRMYPTHHFIRLGPSTVRDPMADGLAEAELGKGLAPGARHHLGVLENDQFHGKIYIICVNTHVYIYMIIYVCNR